MRRSRFVTLALGLTLVLGAPVPGWSQEETAGSDDICSENATVSPGDAARALQASLPSGVTLGTGSEADIIDAFKAASRNNHGYAGELASLIAIGRPDLIEPLREAVGSLCSANAEAILRRIAVALGNPTADQLAAIATTDGTSPAAGPDAGSDPDGSAQ